MSNVLNLKGVKLFAIIVLAMAMLVTFGVVAVQQAKADCSITTTLRVGSRGAEVMCLQTNLGVGADGIFGPITKAAVMAFQTAHGLVADGIFGPISRAAWMASGAMSGNFPAGCQSSAGYSPTTGVKCDSAPSTGLPAGCSSTVGYSVTTGQPCSGSSSGGGSLSGGETDVSGVNVDDADDTNLNEGDNKAPVADISFDVDDADAELVRADVVFQLEDGNSGEDKPWRAFDKAYLMDGSTVLASIDASDQDNWDDADDINSNSDSDANRLRFNNVNKIYKEGSNNNDLWVAVDIADSVDGSEDSAETNWDVGIDTDGLRFTDGAGIDTFVDSSDVASFSIEQAGAQSDVTITQDTSSPDAGTLEVDTTTSTTATIAVFKVKADSDGGDVKIDDFPVTLTIAGTGSENTEDVVDDVMIVVDGTTYNTDTDGEADSATTYHFTDIEDDDVVINAGDSTKVTVKVKFKSQDSGSYANGVTIVAQSAADDSDFEDADTGDDIGDVSGTPTAEVQQLFAEGIDVSDFSSTLSNTDDGAGHNISGTYDISFKVTAFGDTFYVPKTLVRGTTSSSAGLLYTIEDGSGSTTTTAGATASSLTSSADTVGGYFEIPEGETETLHATIVVTKGSDGVDFYRVQLGYVGYDTDQTGTVTDLQLLPAQDYETEQVSIEI